MSNNLKLKIGIIAFTLALIAVLAISENVDPSHDVFWTVKRAEEKLFLKFKPGQSKIDYSLFLLNRRLDELTSLVKDKQYDFIVTASQRYFTTAGELTKMVSTPTDKARLIQTFTAHRQRLVDLYASYPKGINDEGKFIQDDINYLDIYLSQLN